MKIEINTSQNLFASATPPKRGAPKRYGANSLETYQNKQIFGLLS